MSTKDFEKELDQVYKQYRHRELDKRLNEVAEIMEETVLQTVLATTIFEIEVDIQEERKQTIQEMNEYLETNNFEKIEENIDELEQEVEEERRRVDVKIQDVRSDMADRVSAMKRLNQRLEQIEEDELEGLATLFNNWNWKEDVYDGQSSKDIQSLKNSAQNYGSSVRQSYDQAKDELFGPYEGTELEEIVNGLLNEKRFALNNLTDEQMERLCDSALEEHVELSLS